MTANLGFGDGISLAIVHLTESASEALALLLETKHLYQKTKIDMAASIAFARDKVSTTYKGVYDAHVKQSIGGPFAVVERARTNKAAPAVPTLFLKNVKLFCVRCDSCEVFSPLFHRDLTNEILKTRTENPTLEVPLRDQFQIFAFCFQCQRCKADPITFLVRRFRWDLVLDGRSPMEQVEVPREIPKQETGYFRDSIIAYQSGKPLAGILYLRVFLEAFARRQTGRTTRATGDELMDDYAQLLPSDKRSLMPSLKEWYASLSEAIHTGKEDGDLYQAACSEVHRHFEFRRLFQIADVTAPIDQDADSVAPQQ